MQVRLDPVLIGWILSGVVVLLALVSAIVGVASGQSGGFDLFLARLAPPLGVALLIVAATWLLKLALARQGAPVRTTPAASGPGRASVRVRTAAPSRAGGGSLRPTLGRQGGPARLPDAGSIGSAPDGGERAAAASGGREGTARMDLE